VLVPGGGFGESQSIDLAWDANLETDMLGYNVYRSEGAGFVRLNAELVQAPAYRDMQVQPGHTYTYRVTAVDRRHNESVPGAEVQETLRK
jgi:fibronectin type 3 domain-containing protein